MTISPGRYGKEKWNSEGKSATHSPARALYVLSLQTEFILQGTLWLSLRLQKEEPNHTSDFFFTDLTSTKLLSDVTVLDGKENSQVWRFCSLQMHKEKEKFFHSILLQNPSRYLVGWLTFERPFPSLPRAASFFRTDPRICFRCQKQEDTYKEKGAVERDIPAGGIISRQVFSLSEILAVPSNISILAPGLRRVNKTGTNLTHWHPSFSPSAEERKPSPPDYLFQKVSDWTFSRSFFVQFQLFLAMRENFWGAVIFESDRSFFLPFVLRGTKGSWIC